MTVLDLNLPLTSSPSSSSPVPPSSVHASGCSASVGRGPWDPPRRLVAVGPYRWVRNPIYIAALLVMFCEAWLFVSLPLVLYAVAAAAACHLFVVGYEEPALRAEFGAEYAAYRRSVSR